MYQDRIDAGRKLAKHLIEYKDQHPAVVALPRGGVPVGYEVAHLLGAPLDVVVVRKLGFPGQSELAIGAIADGDKWDVVMNNEIVGERDLPPQYIEQEIADKLDEIRTMENVFRKHRPAVPLTGNTVIVVDDGIATGATMRVAVKRIRRDKPRKIIVAAPVASQEAVALLKMEADEIICPNIPEYFMAVAGFYADFPQVSNQEVTNLLDQIQHNRNFEKRR